MNLRPVSLISATLTLAMPHPGLAQSTICGATHAQAASPLTGQWVLTQLPGVAIAPGFPIPVVGVQRGSVRLIEDAAQAAEAGPVLTVDVPMQSERMRLSPATGNGNFDLPGGTSFVDAQGAPIATDSGVNGCTWAQMPRYAGQYPFAVPGFGSWVMQLAVHFSDENSGYGFVRFFSSEGALLAVRPIQLSR